MVTPKSVSELLLAKTLHSCLWCCVSWCLATCQWVSWDCDQASQVYITITCLSPSLLPLNLHVSHRFYLLNFYVIVYVTSEQMNCGKNPSPVASLLNVVMFIGDLQ